MEDKNGFELAFISDYDGYDMMDSDAYYFYKATLAMDIGPCKKGEVFDVEINLANCVISIYKVDEEEDGPIHTQKFKLVLE